MLLDVRVHARSKLNVVEMSDDGSVRVRVTASPEKGKANDAVVKLLADRLGTPKSSIAIVRGHRSRNKVVRFDGLDKQEIESRLGPAG